MLPSVGLLPNCKVSVSRARPRCRDCTQLRRPANRCCRKQREVPLVSMVCDKLTAVVDWHRAVN